MIQNIITRMGANSFSLKSWAVTLVAGILALSSNETDKTYFLIAFIPIVVFWFLDSYYLQLERKYIQLFEYIRKSEYVEIDFDLKLKKAEYQIKNNEKLKFYSCFFSKTEWLFYIPIGIIVGIVMAITNLM